MSEWSAWSACSVSCGKGLRMRTREYRLPQKATMFACDRQLISKEMCVADVPECPLVLFVVHILIVIYCGFMQINIERRQYSVRALPLRRHRRRRRRRRARAAWRRACAARPSGVRGASAR